MSQKISHKSNEQFEENKTAPERADPQRAQTSSQGLEIVQQTQVSNHMRWDRYFQPAKLIQPSTSPFPSMHMPHWAYMNMFGILIQDNRVWVKLTVSSKDDVTAALVIPPVLILARTGAPNPIEESWRLRITPRKFQYGTKWRKHAISLLIGRVRLPFWDSLFQVYKSTTAYKENVFRVNLQRDEYNERESRMRDGKRSNVKFMPLVWQRLQVLKKTKAASCSCAVFTTVGTNIKFLPGYCPLLDASERLSQGH